MTVMKMSRLISRCLKGVPHKILLQTVKQRSRVPFTPMYRLVSIRRNSDIPNQNNNNSGDIPNNTNIDGNNNDNTSDHDPSDVIDPIDSTDSSNNNNNNNSTHETVPTTTTTTTRTITNNELISDTGNDKDDNKPKVSPTTPKLVTNLMLKQRERRKFLIGIDGTKYGYYALEHAFSLTNANDKIIGLHIPPEFIDDGLEMQDPFVYRSLYNYQKDESPIMDEEKQLLHQKLKIKTYKINNSINKNNTEYEFLVYKGPNGDVPRDLCHAVNKFKADYLVIGHRGVAHSIRETINDITSHFFGSVAEYCVLKANCTVIVAKPEDAGLY